MAQPSENNSQEPPCTADNIIRSASVIACSATGYACPLEDLMQTSDIMESSVNLNAPTPGPSRHAATEIIQSASVIACSSTGYAVSSDEVERSLRVIDSAAAANQADLPDVCPPRDTLSDGSYLHTTNSNDGSGHRVVVRGHVSLVDGVERPNHLVDSGNSSATSSGVTNGGTDSQAPGTSSRRSNSARQLNEAGRSGNADLNMSRGERSLRHSSHSDLRYVCRIQRVTRSSMRSGQHNTPDANVSSFICTTRAARSNSFRARRDALKARSDASRARNSASRSTSVASGETSANAGASSSSNRNSRSTGGPSGRLTRSTSGLSVSVGTSDTATRSASDASESMRRSATEITSISVNSQKSTKIIVRTATDTPFPTASGSGMNIGETSGTSSTIPVRVSGGRIKKRSAKSTSRAIPLPAGDGSGRIKRFASGTSTAIALPGGDGFGMTTSTATVTSADVIIPGNGTAGTTERSATITIGTNALPIDVGSADASHSDTDAVLIPIGDGSSVITHSASDISDPITHPVNELSGNITRSANDISDDITEPTDETSTVFNVTAANISYPPGNISCVSKPEEMSEMTVPPTSNIIVHSGNITVRPLSPAISMPSVIAEPPPPVDSISAIGTSSSSNERTPGDSADAEGNFFF